MRLLLNGCDWKITGWWKNQWRFTRSMELGEMLQPAVATFTGTVPGAVQRDLIRTGQLPDPNYGLDSNAGEWVNNREWFYDKEFLVPEEFEHEKYILCFEGLDFQGEIYFNKKKIQEFSGMFQPVHIDVTAEIRRGDINFLRVVFFQTPEVDGQFGYTSRIGILKSRFNYIWDWCPRIIPVGIWDDVYIEGVDHVRLLDFYPETVSEDNGKGTVHLHLEVEAACAGIYEVCCSIMGQEGIVAEFRDTIPLIAAKQKIVRMIQLEQVRRWWPHGMGEANLYRIKLEILRQDGVLTAVSQKNIGFRKLAFERNPGAPDNSLPYTLQINGIRTFLRGINWVPLSPFYGEVTHEQYRQYLKRFKDMNCNLLRVWGGAILEKREFYDLCDEMGLMVWQEFPQSSSGMDNTPPDDTAYLQELEKVGKTFILRRRHHASHIIWCGGNELLTDGFTPVDDTHVNIRILRDLVRSLDPSKLYLPSSPSGPRFSAGDWEFNKNLHHDVHGPWTYLGEPAHYTYFNGDDALFRSETGCPGMSRLETLERYKGSFSVWPPDMTNPYWTHRGSWWIPWKDLQANFSEWEDQPHRLKLFMQCSRFLQAEVLRYAVETMRRREPVTSGFLLWMGNETYPNNANTSVLEYDGTPKPAYYWVGKAFDTLHCSARYDKCSWKAGEEFHVQLYITSDAANTGEVRLQATLRDIRGQVFRREEFSVEVHSPSMYAGEMIWQVAPVDSGVFFIEMELSTSYGCKEKNTYCFTVDADKPFRPLTTLPGASLSISKHGDGGEWVMENVSAVAAVGAFIYGKNPDDFIEISPNYLVCMPGEKVVLHVALQRELCQGEIPFAVEALNIYNET